MIVSKSKKSLSSSSLASLSSSVLSIESINQTEACVFYVLSQLSHADKPSPHLLAQFDALLVCLLTYLRKARIRNPRALRILNRLTKNPNCFASFVLAHFPYKLKSMLTGDGPSSSSNENNTAATSLLARPTTLGDHKLEADIEKEMDLYLNSNKVRPFE